MKHHPLLILALSITAAQADTFGSGANQFDINFVTIGNAGNAADTTGSPNPAGSVGYTYRMGVSEVSRGMISSYNTLGGGPALTLGDMTLRGGNGVNRPATGISWNEAARFVNWLNTTKGYSEAYKFTTGGFNDNITLWSSGDAGYNASNPFRNANAHYFLPSNDEWYKAAYYDPNKSGGAGYWDYATGSDSAPVSVADGTTSGTAVYDRAFPNSIQPADVTNAGGLSPYGTMAQNGNAQEWTESVKNSTSVSGARPTRGGGYSDFVTALDSKNGVFGLGPTSELLNLGFRVAAVPEPSGVLLTCIGMMSVILRRRR